MMKMSTVQGPLSKGEQLTTNNEELLIDYVIPVEGSLGLLAMGAKGLREWREIRELHKKMQDASIKTHDTRD